MFIQLAVWAAVFVGLTTAAGPFGFVAACVIYAIVASRAKAEREAAERAEKQFQADCMIEAMHEPEFQDLAEQGDDPEAAREFIERYTRMKRRALRDD